VIKYYDHINRKLLHSEIIRTSRDRRAEASALSALRRAPLITLVYELPTPEMPPRENPQHGVRTCLQVRFPVH